MHDDFEGLDLLICLPHELRGWQGPEHKRRKRRYMLYEESGVLVVADRSRDRT